MFEKASRLKFRYDSERGSLNTEDLWNVPLTSTKGFSLDEVAKSLSREIKNEEEESFVEENVKKDTSYKKDKLEIVKHIIKIKIDEKKQREKVAEKRVMKDKILNIIAEKQVENLKGESIENLTKMLDDLGNS